MNQSQEEVALALLQMIAVAENKRISAEGTGAPISRTWVLSTYRQCLKAVKFSGGAEGAASAASLPTRPRVEATRAA